MNEAMLIENPKGRFPDGKWSELHGFAFDLDSYEYLIVLTSNIVTSHWNRTRWIVLDDEFRRIWHRLDVGVIQWHNKWLYRRRPEPTLLHHPVMQFANAEDMMFFKLTANA